MRPERWLYTIPLRLRLLFRWAQADQELDDELRDHLDRKTEEYVRAGVVCPSSLAGPPNISLLAPIFMVSCGPERTMAHS